jgi:hypothetical protein
MRCLADNAPRGRLPNQPLLAVLWYHSIPGNNLHACGSMDHIVSFSFVPNACRASFREGIAVAGHSPHA